MKADAKYRIGRVDSDGAEYVSDDVLDSFETFAHLALEHALLIVGGWDVRRCKCGLSIEATKDGRTRTVVALPVEDITTIETLALAVGVLTPASHRAGLVSV